MTHSELCLKTAKRFINKVALYEYKSFASMEEPDVLVFGYGWTMLFEIKMSRSDFLADAKKPCRRKYKINHYMQPENIKDSVVKRAYIRLKQYRPEIFLKEAPHLGNQRYFVCEDGLIQVEELPEGWGLYWFKGGKFYQKRASAKFRSNLKVENDLLIHAIRRHASGDDTGILVNSYGGEK